MSGDMATVVEMRAGTAGWAAAHGLLALALALPPGTVSGVLLALPLAVVGFDRARFGPGRDPAPVTGELQLIDTDRGPGEVLAAAVAVVAHRLRLSYAVLELTGPGGEVVLAAHHGHPPDRAVTLVLRDGTAVLGRLAVAGAARREPFGPGDRGLVAPLTAALVTILRGLHQGIALQRARQDLATAREEERRRLRRDLHDGLGPTLAAQALQLAAARELLAGAGGAPVDQVDRILGRAEAAARDALADIRRLGEQLRPPALDRLGLAGALAAAVDGRNAAAGTRYVLDVDGDLGGLPAAVETALYRIATEALTNAARHAGAATCRLRVARHDAVELEVRDDGAGPAPGSVAHIGLLAMGERAGELGGTIAFTTPPGGGFAVTVRIPLVGVDRPARGGAAGGMT